MWERAWRLSMPITIDDLRAFIEIQKSGSFAAAADALCLTSPALTRRIGKIEEFVGDSVFDRSTSPIRLSVAGELFIERARPVLMDFDDFLRFSESIVTGNLIEVSFASIMSISASIIPRMISQYRSEVANTKFRVLDCNGLDVEKLVREDAVEFGISTQPSASAGLRFERLTDEEIVFVCRDDHPLASKRQMGWSRLANQNVMMLGGASSTTRHIIDGLAQAGIAAPNGIQLQQLSTLIGFVESGIGGCVLPSLATRLFRSERIKIVPLSQPVIKRDIGIVTRPQRELSKPAHAFRDWLAEKFDAFLE